MILADEPISPQFDRLPPHSVEAEICTIASMLLAIDAKEFSAIVSIVGRDDFYSADNQVIYDAMIDLRRRGPCDSVLLRNWLTQRGLYEEIGGNDYLRQLLDTVPSAAHGVHYATIVKQKSTLRGCIAAANDILRRAYQDNQIGIDIAADGVRCLSTIAANGDTQRIVRINAAVDEVIRRKEGEEVYRIPTGIIELDDAIGGLPLGKYVIVGGRPGMGKSLLLKQALRNIAQRGIPVGIVTIEENQIKIAENCLSATSGIDNNKIAFQNWCKEEWEAVTKARMELESLPLFIADYPVRLAEVENAIARLVTEHGCKVIGVDYVQLIDGNDQNENREITMVSRAIKAAFKRLNVAGMVAAQLNRGSEQGEPRWPTLKDLRGSGSLEQDGDIVILLHAEDYYRRQKGDHFRDGKLMLLVRKNKDGCQADIPVFLAQNTQEIRTWVEPTSYDGGQI